jgi:hypothetical protein
MFGLPSNTDLNYLINCELQQISIGLHQVILRFSNDLQITVESKLEVKENASASVTCSWEGEQIVNFDNILKLINTSIKQYKILDDKNLVLEFSNNNSLIIYDNHQAFESYQIMLPGRSIIV